MTGKLHVLRPQHGVPADSDFDRLGPTTDTPPDTDSQLLLDYARRAREHVLRAPPAAPHEKRHVLVLSADRARYGFLREAVLTAHQAETYESELPNEAIAWLSTSVPVCAAVLVEVELAPWGNGYRTVEAFRLLGYQGPMLLVMTRETPNNADRAYARRRGADEIVRFHELALARWVGQALDVARYSPSVSPSVARARAEVVPRQEGERRFPPWVAVVIRELVYHLGPSGGDLVREEYLTIKDRYRTDPEPEVLLESLGESLSNKVPDWYELRRTFMDDARKALEGSGKGRPS